MLAKNAKRIENVKKEENKQAEGDDAATEKKEEQDNVEMTVKPEINEE